MSDNTWYYAVEDKAVGPLSLADLTVFFSRVSNARDVLVWRAGFEQWQRAANVPELAVLVIKPPLLPPLSPSVPPLPPVLPHDRLIVPTDEQSSRSKRGKVRGYVATAAVIAMAAAGVRFLSHSGGVSLSPNPSSIISGKERESFVTVAMDTCLKKQMNDPDNKALSLSKEVMEKYCSCYVNALADAVTHGEIKDAPNDGSVPPTFQKKISAANASCADKFRRSLLGG